MLGRSSTFIAVAMVAATLAGVTGGAAAQQPVPPGADEKVTIKVRYTPGTYVMTRNTDMQGEMTTLGGEPENQDIKNQIVIEMTAEKPQDDGHQKIAVIWKRVTFSMTGLGMSVTYDSAQPEDESNPMVAVYRDMIGVPIEVLLDEDGNVIKTTRMENTGEATAKEPPAGTKNTEQMITDKMFGFLKQWTPKVPVTKGDRWTTTIKQGEPIMGEMDIKTNCRLEEIRQTKGGKLAVIAFDGKASKGKAKTPEGAPAIHSFDDFLGKMDIEFSGKLTINVDTGMVDAVDMDQTTRADMFAMDTDDPGWKGVQITMKAKTTVRFTPGAYEPEPGSQ